MNENIESTILLFLQTRRWWIFFKSINIFIIINIVSISIRLISIRKLSSSLRFYPQKTFSVFAERKLLNQNVFSSQLQALISHSGKSSWKLKSDLKTVEKITNNKTRNQICWFCIYCFPSTKQRQSSSSKWNNLVRVCTEITSHISWDSINLPQYKSLLLFNLKDKTYFSNFN